MYKLYSYRVKYDQGSAPNPFGGVCTLVICKPAIRRTAKVGDWIVGTGSSRFGFQNHLIYAMEVTEVMTMHEYDQYCNSQLKQKLPKPNSGDFEERIGDCIYDYSTCPATVRPNYTGHDESNFKHDDDGKNALLSDHFYYFGSKPLELKGELQKIIKTGPGHKAASNSKYFEAFVTWITSKGYARNKVAADPYLKSEVEADFKLKSKCLPSVQCDYTLTEKAKISC